MPEFYLILARKIGKIPEFLLYLPEKFKKSQILHDFCPKNARILHNNCPKNIFPNFRGHVSYAYAAIKCVPTLTLVFHCCMHVILDGNCGGS